MERKKIGYYISKGKCLKVFAVKKLNKKTNRHQVKKVNYKGKAIKKGTKIYKTKAECDKKVKKMLAAKKSKSTKRSPIRKRTKRSKFGSCSYNVPYFGDFVPTVSKFASGTPLTGMSSYAWGWPTPPSALAYDRQQGGWMKH